MTRTLLFLVFGVVGAGAAIWFYESDNTLLSALLSVAILLPVIGSAWWLAWRSRLVEAPPSSPQLVRLAVATPFPYTLLIALYGLRTDWLPDSWQEYLNNPTAYLLFITGSLAVSLVWTSAILSRALPSAPPETVNEFRTVGIAVFVLMGAAGSLGDPVWITDLFRYVLEPGAIVLFAAAFGWRLGVSPRPRLSSLEWEKR